MDSSAFSLQLEDRLGSGKYTKWATRGEFSKAHLKCLLWMVGEFDASASELLDLLAGHRSDLGGAERALLALGAICCMARGERFGVNEWAQRMHQGRAYLEISDLPESVRSALHVAAPGATWEFVMMIPEGYEVGGKDVTRGPLHAILSAQGAVNYLGQARQRGEQKLASVFSAELEQELNRNKYTKWATDREFSAEHLRCLLWMVGEFYARSRVVLEVLNREQAKLADHRRAVIALEAMSCMAEGEWIDAAELVRRMDCGGARLGFNDVPEALRAAVQHAAPQVIWNFVMMRPDGYLLGTEGQWVSAVVQRAGKVTLRTFVGEDKLPVAVLAAVMKRVPKFKILMAQLIGPALGTIHRYEVDLVPLGGEKQKFVVSADGLNVTLVGSLQLRE